MSWLLKSGFLARTLRSNATIRALAVRNSSHGHDKPAVPVNEPPNDHLHFKVATIDDLPPLETDYYEHFRKQNRKYWGHFILGVSWLAFSIYAMCASEIITWNMYPPPMPPKEERIKSFWVRPTYWDDDDDDDEEEE